MIARFATDGGVAAANHLAAAAGAAILQRGGNAVDAAIAATTVMAVTEPAMCGLGGDLFALVARSGEPPLALNASGRAGSGANPDGLRAEDRDLMPFALDVRGVTVPGCVDGLIALHERFATIPLAELMLGAHRLASDGFPVSPMLAATSGVLSEGTRAEMLGDAGRLAAGERLALPALAATLAAIAERGRAGFYEGEPGRELIELGAGEFSDEDVRARQADWVAPLGIDAFGRRLWTAPPNSQGYLALAGAWIAEQVGVPDDPADERWAFVLVEAARQAGFDRLAVLHEDADATRLLAPERLAPRAAAIGERASPALGDHYRDGDTTFICAVDRDRTGVSLITSNGASFGSRLGLARSGVFLHNRGAGFSLQAGHPAEYGPGKRPPHTLVPLVVTDGDGTLDTVLGTAGADAQPQIDLQLLARALLSAQDPGAAIASPRWTLARRDATPFHVWTGAGAPMVQVEPGAPPAWAVGLRRRGYEVSEGPIGEHSFGQAQMIRLTEYGTLAGAADPRSGAGAFVAY